MKFILNFILFSCSIISLIFIKIFYNNKSCIYINENKHDIIEKRSKWIVRDYKPKYFLVHSIYFLPSFINFFLRFPSIYVDSMMWFYFKFKNNVDNKFKERFYISLLNILSPSKIYILDDLRHIPPIIKASNIKNIENFCYMHGQIYETHKEIFNSNPRNYIVWGNFFYKMVNKYAPNTNVIKVKYPYFNFKINKKLKQNKNKIKKILFIEEYQGDVEIYNNIFKNLKNKYLFFYRPKLRSTIKNKIDNIEKLNPKINILESIRNNNIDLVIGTSSNILLESYLVDVLSASVEKKNNLLSFYQTKYKLVYNLNLISVDKDLHYIFKNYKKLLDKYKQRTWGNEKKI